LKCSRSSLPIILSRYLFVPISALIVSLITYFHPSFWTGNVGFLRSLLNREDLNDPASKPFWVDDESPWVLFSGIIIRTIVFIIMANCPMPLGVSAPAMLIGATVGRLYACNEKLTSKTSSRQLSG
jgi:H+/Cl- antiporter ClcA